MTTQGKQLKRKECTSLGWRAGVRLLFVLALGAAPLDPGFASPSFKLDWQIRDVNLKGTDGSKVESPEVGENYYVYCAWTAVVSETGYHEKDIGWTGKLNILAGDPKVENPTKQFKVSYPANTQTYMKPGSTIDSSVSGTALEKEIWADDSVFGTATNEFNGSMSMPWKPDNTGTVMIGCAIAFEGAYTAEDPSDRWNNSRTRYVTVGPSSVKPMTTTEWPTAPIILEPIESQEVDAPVKIVVAPRQPSDECTMGGVIQLEREAKGDKLAKPLVAKCAPEGTVFEVPFATGRPHEVRARLVNDEKGYKSQWSEWRKFVVKKSPGREQQHGGSVSDFLPDSPDIEIYGPQSGAQQRQSREQRLKELEAARAAERSAQRAQTGGRTPPPRLIAAEQRGTANAALLTWTAPATTERTADTTAELRLAGRTVGQAPLRALGRGEQERLTVPFSLPDGTRLPVLLEVWVGGSRVGSVRIGATGERGINVERRQPPATRGDTGANVRQQTVQPPDTRAGSRSSSYPPPTRRDEPVPTSETLRQPPPPPSAGNTTTGRSSPRQPAASATTVPAAAPPTLRDATPAAPVDR